MTHLTGFGNEAVFMARTPDEEIERLTVEISLERLAEVQVGADAAWSRPDWTVSVSRRPGTEFSDLAG
jgi:hypothetical protein